MKKYKVIQWATGVVGSSALPRNPPPSQARARRCQGLQRGQAGARRGRPDRCREDRPRGHARRRRDSRARCGLRALLPDALEHRGDLPVARAGPARGDAVPLLVPVRAEPRRGRGDRQGLSARRRQLPRLRLQPGRHRRTLPAHLQRLDEPHRPDPDDGVRRQHHLQLRGCDARADEPRQDAGRCAQQPALGDARQERVRAEAP
jgi:hypothetical protein